MKRNLKGLGLALVALLAMSASVSQSAQAAPGKLTAATYPATLTGTGIFSHKFEFESFKLSAECSTSKFAGQVNSPGSSTVTLTPTYESCKAFGLAATIDTSGCDYVFHIGETYALGEYHVPFDIECSGVNLIKITAGVIGNKCEIQIGTQTGLFAGQIANTVSDLEFLANHVPFITYKVTKDEGTCPLSKAGTTFFDGSYSGWMTLSGSSSLGVTD